MYYILTAISFDCDMQYNSKLSTIILIKYNVILQK